MLVRRMLHATSTLGVSWKVVTVQSSFSYGTKDYGENLALETLPHPPEVERTLSLEYALAPLYALFPPLRSMPDTRFGWVPFGVSRAAKILEQAKYDVLVTWAQPYSSHVAGWRLKKRFPELSWVAYFGDPWVGNPYIEKIPKICLEWERKVVARSDRIIVNTRGAREDFAGRYGAGVKDKIDVIPHSYDHAWLGDEKSPGEERRPRPCTLTYGGNFYGKRTPEPVLKALEALIPKDREALRVQFVGKFPFPWQSRAEKLAPSVAVLGQKSYGETQNLLKTSDILLLIDAPLAESMFLPSKLVDYLALGKPILALTPKGGASWEALEGVEHVCRIDTLDSANIEVFLKRLARGEILFRKKVDIPEAFTPEAVGAKWERTLRRSCRGETEQKRQGDEGALHSI